MTTQVFYRPIIPLLLSLIFGIFIGSEAPGDAIWTWVAGTVCIGGIAWGVYRGKYAAILPILLFALLGYLSIQPWTSPKFPANHIIHYADTHSFEIVGRLHDPPQRNNRRTRFDLEVESLSDGGRTIEVVGKLRVTAGGRIPSLASGNRLAIKGRIRSINNFNNPGGFNYKKHLALQGIWASSYVKEDGITIIDSKAKSNLQQLIADTRNRFGVLIEQSVPLESAGVLKALIIGDRAGIAPQAREAFNRAGVGHLLAISGLHIGIVAAVAFVFFKWWLVRLQPLLWRGWTRKAAALLTLVPVVVYGLMSGLSAATLRAVIMGSIFLMTYLVEREHNPINTLALAALAILVADPPALFSISFQLSFTAVLGILLGFSGMQARFPWIKPSLPTNWRLRWLRKLVAFFLVSLFAVCGSLPLVMFYFNQISLVGLLANFFIVPLIGFIVVPLGLLALFWMPVSVTIAAGCLTMAGEVLRHALAMVDGFAELTFAAIKTVTPSILEMACFYGLFWALWHLVAGKPKITAEPMGSRPETNHPSGRTEKERFFKGLKLNKYFQRSAVVRLNRFKGRNIAVSAIFIILCVLAVDTGYWLHQRFWHADLRVTIIDVGEGSAALLELPGGYTILLDGGGFTDNTLFDMGARVVAPFLWRKKIRTVDTLILSHPNSDHFNGFTFIADHFGVKDMWTTNEASDTSAYRALMQVVAKRNIHLHNYRDLPADHRINGVDLKILYPPKDFADRKASQKWRNSNNNSLVVKVSFGQVAILFPGDITSTAEAELVAIAGRNLASTILIAPHHGSSSSSTDIFLDAVKPDVVIVSCGRNRRFNFPHPTVVKRYHRRGCTVLRTDRNGAVDVSIDGQRLRIKPHVTAPSEKKAFEYSIHCCQHFKALRFKGFFDGLCFAGGQSDVINSPVGLLSRNSHIDNVSTLIGDDLHGLLECARPISDHHVYPRCGGENPHHIDESSENIRGGDNADEFAVLDHRHSADFMPVNKLGGRFNFIVRTDGDRFPDHQILQG
jgi:competence protein ComEC